MEETMYDIRQSDTLEAWQQALAEVPQSPALSGALLRPRADLFGRFASWYGRLRSRPRAERRRWQRQLGLSLAGIALLLAMHGAPAGAASPTATINVDGVTCTLADAITAANTNTATGGCDAGSAGADTLNLTANIGLTAALPAITTPITIEGNGNTISRQSGVPNFRILAVGGGGNLTLNSATISGGVASGTTYPNYLGGGVFFGIGASGTLSHSTISGNSARGGGGLYATNATVTVANSTISGNSASNFGGGGISGVFGSLTVSNSTLSGNIGFGDGGGGIRISSGTLVVSASTLTGNSGGGGGGIMARYSSVSIVDSTLSGNSVIGNGGGIRAYSSSTTMTVQNSTLSGNSASSGGGGIIASSATVTISNSTVSGNSALAGSGIWIPGGAAVTVLSSIVALQTAGGDCSGALTSGGYNIESGTSCGFTGTGDLRNVSSASLALGALANNGGPTQTRALGAGSVAIDRIPVGALEANGCGVTVITDQRGFPRANGATSGGASCDVGAYEVQVPLAVTLASFDAQAMVDHILLTWESVSEVNNAGFNLYRSASPAGPDALLAFVPSQAPGSTVGASYTFADAQVAPGETWYYWLEDVDLNGATSLHGPVSATLQAPTAVTLDALEAQAANPGSVTTWGALVAGLLAAAGALAARRRAP